MRCKDLTQKSGSQYLSRVAKVTESSERKWGTMTPAQMLAHVSLLVEASIGELHIEGNGKIPIKWLKPIMLTGMIPFPKGGVLSPQVVLDDDADNVAKERERLDNSIKRFLGLSEKEPNRREKSPVFGFMTMTQWARLHGMHLNHHMHQFSL